MNTGQNNSSGKPVNQLNKLIDEALNSINNIERAVPGEEIVSKILSSSRAARIRMITLPPATKWVAAACIALLFAVNVFTAIQYKKQNMHSEANPVYGEYFSYFHNF